MHIPISYKDDRRKAEEIMLEAVGHNTHDISHMVQPELDRLHRRYFIEAPIWSRGCFCASPTIGWN